MAKGWNKDHLNDMINYYKKLCDKEQTPETKKLYREIVGVYEILLLKLILQDGNVSYSKVTTKSFLDEYNIANNIHIYPEHYNKVMNRFALEVERLPRIVIPNYRRKISKEESYDIVGAFVKYYFGEEGLQIYESEILDRPEYTLYDHINENSSVIYAGDEVYLSLRDVDDIRFTSALAHEAGHLAKSAINNFPPEFNPLGEFESFSYQIRLLIFMINRGIYSRDALKELLSLMNLAERVSITKRVNCMYKLNKIKDPSYFELQVEKLRLMDRAGIPNMRAVYDNIASTLDKDYIVYIYSLLMVFSELTNPDYLSTYYDVVGNIGYETSKSLVRRNNISISRGMENYKQLRSELVRLI